MREAERRVRVSPVRETRGMNERPEDAPHLITPIPPAVRVTDRLIDVLVLVHELLQDFQTEEANALRWAEPRVQRVYDDVDAVLRRLGS
jgi:hypothetical protein